MGKKNYTIDDFQIGESVVPLNSKELPLVIVNIDRELGIIICKLSIVNSVHAYFPHELEKEYVVRPPNIDVPKPKKDDTKEKQED